MGTTRTVIFLLAAIQAAMCNVSPDPRIFFPSINGNLTKIVWAHAVNSQADLERVLASDDIMMLEADVVVGKLNVTTNATNPDIPIMAHPPATVSDLSLEDFLRSVVEKNTTKGIKLDFKSIEAFEMSKPILNKTHNELIFPVFLNADILPGPVNATTTPVSPKSFIAGAMEILPNSVLSVGWTTRYGEKENITEGRYTEEQVQRMIDSVTEQHVKQPVTYPVRAGLAANDISAIKKLMENSTALKDATLTIWSSEGDHVNTEELSKLVRDIGTDKIYLDVPDDLKKMIDFSGAASLSATLLISLGPLLVTLLLSRML